MKEKIPSEDDWGEYWKDLDQEFAHKVFFGKSNREIQEEFKFNIIERTEELRFMPAKVFQYYIIGFCDYILTLDFDDIEAADAANCFLDLIYDKSKMIEYNLESIFPNIWKTIVYIVENQKNFSADNKIYGDFQEKAEMIKKLWKK